MPKHPKVKRRNVLSVRLSDDEMARLKSLAEIHNVAVGTLVRQHALKAPNASLVYVSDPAAWSPSAWTAG
jgi:predicted transcriptional regulator